MSAYAREVLHILILHAGRRFEWLSLQGWLLLKKKKVATELNKEVGWTPPGVTNERRPSYCSFIVLCSLHDLRTVLFGCKHDSDFDLVANRVAMQR